MNRFMIIDPSGHIPNKNGVGAGSTGYIIVHAKPDKKKMKVIEIDTLVNNSESDVLQNALILHSRAKVLEVEKVYIEDFKHFKTGFKSQEYSTPKFIGMLLGMLKLSHIECSMLNINDLDMFRKEND